MSMAPAHERLERRLEEWAQRPNVVACSSGTAALHLALEALGLPPGSAVLVPDFTMVACARAVSLAGLTPIFIDCDGNLNMDSAHASAAAHDWFSEDHDRRAVMMVVHVYGRCADMDRLCKVARDWGMPVVEDMAEAHGLDHGRATDVVCWSFYKNKIVAGEEGGACSFLSPEHAARARSLRCLGFTPEHDFTHVPRGHNYRLADSLATLVMGSLDCYRDNLELRRRTEAAYHQHCPVDWRLPLPLCPWVYSFRIPGLKPDAQTRVVNALLAAGLGARHAFKPMSQQPEYQHCLSYGDGSAARASREVIYLPLRPALGHERTIHDEAHRAFTTVIRTLDG